MSELLHEKYNPNKDPWRVLVVSLLLNHVISDTAEAVVDEVFKRWPTAQDMMHASPMVFYNVVACLGFGNKRVSNILGMSRQWHILEIKGIDMKVINPELFPGCGPYAREAWSMLVLGKRFFTPQDKDLRRRMDELRDNRLL